MKEYIILDKTDMLILGDNKPITFYIDEKPYIFCTEKYFEKQIIKSQKSKITDNKTSTHKTGHWVSKGDVYPAWKYCSECKEPWLFDCGTPNYCPVCGAKMIESEVKGC